MGNYTSCFHFVIKFRIYNIKNHLIYFSRMQKRSWPNYSYQLLVPLTLSATRQVKVPLSNWSFRQGKGTISALKTVIMYVEAGHYRVYRVLFIFIVVLLNVTWLSGTNASLCFHMTAELEYEIGHTAFTRRDILEFSICLSLWF